MKGNARWWRRGMGAVFMLAWLGHWVAEAYGILTIPHPEIVTRFTPLAVGLALQAWRAVRNGTTSSW